MFIRGGTQLQSEAVAWKDWTTHQCSSEVALSCNQRPLPGRIGQRPSVRPREHPLHSDVIVGRPRRASPPPPRRHSARAREEEREREGERAPWEGDREREKEAGRERQGGRGREGEGRGGKERERRGRGEREGTDEPKRRSSGDQPRDHDQPQRRSDDHEALSDAIGRNHRTQDQPRSRLRLGLLLRPRFRQPLRFQRDR